MLTVIQYTEGSPIRASLVDATTEWVHMNLLSLFSRVLGLVCGEDLLWNTKVVVFCGKQVLNTAFHKARPSVTVPFSRGNGAFKVILVT